MPISTKVETREAKNARASSALLTGFNASEEILGVTARGFYYADHNKPEDLLKNKVDADLGNGEFSVLITGLKAETIYSFVAYASNADGSSFGLTKKFTTYSYTLPEVETLPVKNVYINSCQVAGSVGYDGGKQVTERGFSYSFRPNSTVQDGKVVIGKGEGPYTGFITGLNENTGYYVRAFATNSLGTSYGSEIFITTGNFSIPIVNTLSVFDITLKSCKATGEVVENGGLPIIERGFIIQTNPDDFTPEKINIPGDIGQYLANLANLLPFTTYYIRAYASNKKGIAYGNPIKLFTSDYTPAEVIMVNVSEIGKKTAIPTGIVMKEGNSPVTEKGFCLSIVPNASISNQRFPIAIGPGTFTYFLANLTENRDYYINAYAINTKGVSYGKEIKFKTLGGNPLIDPTNPTATPPTIFTVKVGDYFQGGIVAYLFQENDPGYIAGEKHGIILSPIDVATSAPWGCAGLSILTAQKTGIGFGNANTNAILRACGTAGIAARLCSAFSYDGYSDWALPAKDELEQVFKNSKIIGGINLDLYWTSSEYYSQTLSTHIAYLMNFVDGTFVESLKNQPYRVRAIRYF